MEKTIPSLGDLIRTADWKAEKHVPVIETPAVVIKGEPTRVTIIVGKETAHPNSSRHHIRWISLYFQPEGDKFPYEIGSYHFAAHGDPFQEPKTSGVYSHHEITAAFKTDKPGTLHAISLCNIHGLWQSSAEIKISGKVLQN